MNWRNSGLLRYPIATLLLLCLALAAIFMGCGDDEIIIQPADVTEQWLGAWRYMQDKDGVLVPDGDQKILFTPEGTYQLSHDETGTYIVLEGSFHIDRTGSRTRTGSWVRNGDILKLVYEDKNIRILKKAVTFQKYTPPPPPPPRPTDHYPSATTATTFPAAGSEVAPNMLLTITLDEAVDGVTVNRTAAAGSGRHWAINLAGFNFPPGSITLNIGWTNKNGTAGVGARVTLTILADADRTAPNIVSSSVLNRERDVEVAPLNETASESGFQKPSDKARYPSLSRAAKRLIG